MLQARPELLQVFQAAAAVGGGSRGSLKAAAAAAALMSERENLPRSRGMDERGARAKADARKRAAARGVNVRLPNNPVPVNSELLNLSTSGGKGRDDSLGFLSKGARKETKEAEAPPAEKEQDKSHVEDVKTHAKTENTSSQDQVPLGLGASLGSLEGKKLKSLKMKVSNSKATES